jgi:hypothetical protein
MQIQAINVTEITGVETTEDGRHALIRFKSGEKETLFAFPFNELMPLMQAASTGFTKCLQTRNVDPNFKHILPCESLATSPSPDFKHMVFSFRLIGGMEMSFQVPREHAEKMRDFMTLMMQEPGKAPVSKPQ